MPADFVGGAALTHGVPEDFAERWFQENQGNPIVMKGLVQAHRSTDAAKGAMREQRAELSGFEPANLKKLPPEFQKVITEETVDDGE